MRNLWLIPILYLAATPVAPAADNQLTPAEKKAGWHLLFDGKTFQNWRDPGTEKPPGDAWAIEDGCFTTRANPHIEEDLVSAKSYGDFELDFDWKVSPGANTGLKYRIQSLVFHDDSKGGAGGFEATIDRELTNPQSDRATMAPQGHAQEYPVAYEFQLLDDARNADAKRGDTHMTGALYSMLAPTKHPEHAAGEWNQSRLIVKGMHFEHWINGEQVLSGSLDDPQGLANLKQRWARGPNVYHALAQAKSSGPFSLQHHGDKVWFKNIKVLEAKH